MPQTNEKKKADTYENARLLMMTSFPFPNTPLSQVGKHSSAVVGENGWQLLCQKALSPRPTMVHALASTNSSLELCTRALDALSEKEQPTAAVLPPQMFSAQDATSLAAIMEPIPIDENKMTVLQGERANKFLLNSLNQQLSYVLEVDNLSDGCLSGITDLEEFGLCSSAKGKKKSIVADDSKLTPKPSKRRKDFQKMHDSEASDVNSPRFREYQTDQWYIRFDELLRFKAARGHCCVRHSHPESPKLARWVKRQRYQYKLKKGGKSSTMTDDRIEALEKVGFVWDSHGASWMERLNELQDYVQAFGNCHISSSYMDSNHSQLASWSSANGVS